MTLSNKQKLLLGFFSLTLLISIPLTISLLKQRQEPRTRASGSTTLSFQPASTTSTPIQKNLGDTIPLDMIVNPGNNNLVSFIRFEVKYDPAKLQLSQTDPFTLNTASFPVKVEGPILTSDGMALSVSIGADPTKAIQTTAKVGTLNLKAIGATGNAATTVLFTNKTQALSAGSNDQAAENVLSTTSPAIITIAGSGSLTPTVSPVPTGTVTPGGTTTPTPSTRPSGTITPTISTRPSGTPTPTPQTTSLLFTALLHGVGAAGDNANPRRSDFSNKNPLHPQRNIDVQIIDSNNQIVVNKTGAVIYDANQGAFIGILDLGAGFPSGNYNIKLKSDRYLRRLIPGIHKITNLTANRIAQVELVAGDVNGDNVLNILDYNALLDCGYGAINPLPMADAHSIFNSSRCQVHTPVENIDIEDNGIINSFDYNLFLRELSVQIGD